MNIKFRNIFGGGGRTLLTLTVVATLFLSSFLPSFAIGEKVKYEAKHVGSSLGDGTAVFTATVNGAEYTGTCAETGVALASEGTGTVESEIDKNSKGAKVLYDLVVNKKWFESPKASQNASDVLGVTTGWDLSFLVECASQISIQKTAWKNSWGSSNPAYDTAMAAWDWYQNYDLSGIDVRDNFEILYVDAGNDQNFIIWRFAPTGKIKLKKVSANTDITR